MFRPLLGRGGVLLNISLSVSAEIWGSPKCFKGTLSATPKGAQSRQGTRGAMTDEETGVSSAAESQLKKYKTQFLAINSSRSALQ